MIFLNLLIFLIIEFSILSSSLIVIKCFLDDGDSQHEYQRGYISECKSYLQRRNELTQRYGQEEEIIEEFELVEQNNWNQCDDIIFLVVLSICWECSWSSRSIKLNLSLFKRYCPTQPSPQVVAGRHFGLVGFLAQK